MRLAFLYTSHAFLCEVFRAFGRGVWLVDGVLGDRGTYWSINGLRMDRSLSYIVFIIKLWNSYCQSVSLKR